RKVYVVQYRLTGLPTKRYTIGPHGSPWTPTSARSEATRVLGLTASGVDPAEEKRLAKKDISVNELCNLYLTHGVNAKKATTIAMDRSRIDAHVRPLLGKKRLKQVSKADVTRFMSSIASGKTAKDVRTGSRGRSIVKGGRGVANRTLGMLGAMFEFAIDEELMTQNPVRGVKKFKEGRPARFLTDAELARLGEALRQSQENGVNVFALMAIRLLLLTGCRKNEILTLSWEEVDFERGFLRLADSKRGSKSVPIGEPVLDCLSNIPRIEGNPFVIAGEKRDAHFVGLQKVWNAVRTVADLNEVRLHDLRHSFASVGAKTGQSLFVIGRVLGHANASTTQRYAHLSDDPVRVASESVSAEIRKRMEG
ncbi:MAG: tyrosine-type recombinase/integrase, partial [Pseudomonadota bacterium]|nr:tyrosine-type recombinase/integrase [Pseudomonadota bacterium]